ncbi:DUF2690 domain-containing protein, partial [Streptomyces sp. NPDC005728]|uniref:DUF2690 domain-containing protein n=1 Tax=Streptomyces sp. NPDC005728 TaxID=3157054 RepID=UPI00340B2598
TMWELAERAWSRAEMRHDRTMEAIRISQARAALGESGATETGGVSGTGGGTTARSRGSATATPRIAGPLGVAPTILPQPTASDADSRERTDRGTGGQAAGEGTGCGPTPGANSWNLAGYQGPSQPTARPGAGADAGALPSVSPDGPGSTPTTPSPYDGQPQAPRPADGPSGTGSAGRQRLTMFLAGLVGVLVLFAAVVFFTHQGSGGKNQSAAKSPSPTPSTSLPAGVKCSGSACTGKDARAMGCSGDLVTTAKTATVAATTLEVRYSKTCGTAWGRITGAAQGDQVQVSVGKVRQRDDITAAGDTIAYTPMIAVKDAAEAKACATLATGQTGCTK